MGHVSGSPQDSGGYTGALKSTSPTPTGESGSTFHMPYYMAVRAVSGTECHIIPRIRSVRYECREMSEVPADRVPRLFFKTTREFSARHSTRLNRELR